MVLRMAERRSMDYVTAMPSGSEDAVLLRKRGHENYLQGNLKTEGPVWFEMKTSESGLWVNKQNSPNSKSRVSTVTAFNFQIK